MKFRDHMKHAFIGAAVAALALSPIAASAQFVLPPGSTYQGHFNSAPAGAPPATTNCTLAAGSTDTDGSCTATSGAPVVTFASAWNTAPFCTVIDSSATPAFVYTVSTTAITITGTTAHVYYYHCAGRNGG